MTKSAYTIEGYTAAIWAEIERQGLLENNAGAERWYGRATCHALTAAQGEAELADWVQEVAAALAEGDRDEARALAGGNPRVVAALGHNTIPLPRD